MLKAYEIYNKENDNGENIHKIVWEETPGKAKADGVNDFELNEPEFTELGVIRRPNLDKAIDYNDMDLFIARLEDGDEFRPNYSYDYTVTKDDVPIIRQYKNPDDYFDALLNGEEKTVEQIEFEER